MTISVQALATRWQAPYASGDHSGIAGIADILKLDTGGSAGLRPHELLKVALASCMIISTRMELAEQRLDVTGVGVAVEVEREEAVSRFRETLILPPQLEGHRSALLARLARSPVRTTPSRTLEFAPGGTEWRVPAEGPSPGTETTRCRNRRSWSREPGRNATMRPLILTGGPAVGNTTCGRALAVERDRAPYIDVNDIRQLILAEPGRNR